MKLHTKDILMTVNKLIKCFPIDASIFTHWQINNFTYELGHKLVQVTGHSNFLFYLLQSCTLHCCMFSETIGHLSWVVLPLLMLMAVVFYYFSTLNGFGFFPLCSILVYFLLMPLLHFPPCMRLFHILVIQTSKRSD